VYDKFYAEGQPKFNLQPTVIDWADAVNEVGASELAKEIIFKTPLRLTLDVF